MPLSGTLRSCLFAASRLAAGNRQRRHGLYAYRPHKLSGRRFSKKSSAPAVGVRAREGRGLLLPSKVQPLSGAGETRGLAARPRSS